MPNMRNISVPDIPGFSEIVLRELALVSLNNPAAEVRIETVFPAIVRIPPDPPRVTTSCESGSTWTFSAKHQTHADGTVEINLNKFLDCIPATIEGTLYSNYIGSVPHLAATSETDQPVFLSYTMDIKPVAPPPQQAFLPQAWDVTIKVRSWKPDGTPAPNIPFSWIAIARTATVTNF
jgi:hypothetical protein